MELVSKVEELDQRVTSNVSDIKLEDIRLIKNTLALDPREQIISQLQSVVVDILIFLEENHISFVDDEMIASLFKLLLKEDECTFESILRLFAGLKSQRLSELVKSHLESSDKADKVTVNLAILNQRQLAWKSKELMVLNSMENEVVTANVLRAYKDQIARPCMEVLYSKLTKKEPVKVFYKIFAEVNEVLKHKNVDLMSCNPEHDEDYVRFICSLIVDEETCTIAYERLYLSGFFSSLFNAMQSLAKLHKIEEKAILPEDVVYIEALLRVISKLVDRKYASTLEEIRSKFYGFVDAFLEVLATKLPLNLKRLIYEILGHLCGASDINRKIQDFLNSGYIKRNAYVDFEYERLCANFDCTAQLLFLCLSLSYVPDLLDFAIHSLTSESPTVSIYALRVFKALRFKEIGGGSHKYLREACYKDKRVAQEIVDYCIEMQHVVPSVELTKAIMAVDTRNFFDYVALFKDFSIYLNPDFLGRLLDDKKGGIGYLKCCNDEIARFVVANKKWFNSFAAREEDPEIQRLLLEMYSNIARISRVVDFSFDDDSAIILPRMYCAPLFKIFSQCLLHCFYNGMDFKKYLIPDVRVGEDDLEDYCTYVKCKIVVGADVNMSFVVQNYGGPCVDDLVGFYRASGGKTHFEPLSLRNRLLEGKKDNSIFVRNYESSSKFERFIMFNIVNTEELAKSYATQRAFERILKAEFNRFRTEGLGTRENILLARNCMLLLLLLESIDPIVRIIDDIPVLPDALNDLAVSVSVKNLCNGGTAYVHTAAKKGNVEMQARLLLMLFIRNLWTNEMYAWAESLKKSARDNKNLVYLFETLRR